MKKQKITIKGYSLECYSINTLVIGSGTASLNAASSLHSMGQEDILIVTEKWGGGTSNNAGSDKQTYYKLSLSGEEPDSVLIMARDIYNGRCMHGDIALCEAQGSVQAFMNLVNLGVKFPRNKYGAWVGYKTDHDPRARATSAGPYTSRNMFEALAADVKSRGIMVIDFLRVIALLTSGNEKNKKVAGALAINLREKDPHKAFVLFNSVNIIMGTGGPAGIYKTSVYPHSQSGSTGIAFEAGATGQNLTESQFGLASVKFRWNLSGSYQQVIPRYISTGTDGKDEKEFMNEFFPDIKTLTKAIFLKGYQWPFDPGKIENYGSSLIDILVFREMTEKHRRVFLDYTRNPTGPAREKFKLNELDEEVADYLNKSGATGDTPYLRLKAMNRPAMDLYSSHNIELSKDKLEIAVCAQHNNGGLKGNIWWESDLTHLFPVGEVNGSHGVYRPGGSALNSGQVGSYRAALFIRNRYSDQPPLFRIFLKNVLTQVEGKTAYADSWLGKNLKTGHKELLHEISRRMSENAGIIRDHVKIKKAKEGAKKMLNSVSDRISAQSVKDVAEGFRIVDHCLTHYVYLESINKYIEEGGRSRGSYLIMDSNGKLPVAGIGKHWKYSLCKFDREIENNILEVRFRSGKVIKKIVKVREIPAQELWFERVWKKNLEDNLTEC